MGLLGKVRKNLGPDWVRLQLQIDILSDRKRYLSSSSSSNDGQTRGGPIKKIPPILDELLEKNVLVDKGIILLERYFNEIFIVFQNDKLDPNKKVNTSFQYSKFWAGFINLLCIFIEESFSWTQLKEQDKRFKLRR